MGIRKPRIVYIQRLDQYSYLNPFHFNNPKVDNGDPKKWLGEVYTDVVVVGEPFKHPTVVFF